ncbi:MAG: nicotinamide-nucleotide adenylyltransferase [Promethearchaeota archaeon]
MNSARNSKLPPCQQSQDSEEEIIACFSPKDIPKFHTGKLNSFLYGMKRSKAHENHIPFVICRIFAWNLQGDTLVQRRALHVKWSGGRYGDSAAGHIRFVPKIDFEFIESEAWRELSEEMGVDRLYGRLYDFHVEQTHLGSVRGVYTFVALVGNEINLNLGEVDVNSGFVTPSRLLQMIEHDPFVPTCGFYWKRLFDEETFSTLRREYGESDKRNSQMSATSSTSSALSLENDVEKPVGLIIGRFQPFHNGHLQFILYMIQQVSVLKIGIGSSQYHSTIDNPFTYLERSNMISQTLLDNGVSLDAFHVFAIPDLHNADLWVNEVIKIVGDFDLFYSNSQWTRQLFQKRGKNMGEIQKFDFTRYNGSNIRQRLLNQLDIGDLVPPAVLRIITTMLISERIQLTEK